MEKEFQSQLGCPDKTTNVFYSGGPVENAFKDREFSHCAVEVSR